MFIWEIAKPPFNALLSFAEAAEIWGMDPSTLRKAVTSGKFNEGKHCRKFGKQWVVTVEAMCGEYGMKEWNEFAQKNKISLP